MVDTLEHQTAILTEQFFMWLYRTMADEHQSGAKGSCAQSLPCPLLGPKLTFAATPRDVRSAVKQASQFDSVTSPNDPQRTCGTAEPNQNSTQTLLEAPLGGPSFFLNFS